MCVCVCIYAYCAKRKHRPFNKRTLISRGEGGADRRWRVVRLATYYLIFDDGLSVLLVLSVKVFFSTKRASESERKEGLSLLAVCKD